MADIKTGQLSRRGFLAGALTAAAVAAKEITFPKQKEDPYDPEKGHLVRALVRCRNLGNFIQIEEKLNNNSMNYHWVLWQNPDMVGELFKDLKISDLIIKGDPLYLAISNPFTSQKTGNDVINVVASAVVFPSSGNPTNPIPRSDLKLVAGGDQGTKPEDFGIFPHITEVDLSTAKNSLKLINAEDWKIQNYKKELEHRLGWDLSSI